jgi:hypothetical protein
MDATQKPQVRDPTIEEATNTFAPTWIKRYSQEELHLCDEGRRFMAIYSAPKVTALQAQATANLFLSEHLPDRFTADQPQLNAGDNVWCIPVVLAYPGVGAVGCVGEICIHTLSDTVASHTPLAEMKQAAQALYDMHRDAIEAAFS